VKASQIGNGIDPSSESILQYFRSVSRADTSNNFHFIQIILYLSANLRTKVLNDHAFSASAKDETWRTWRFRLFFILNRQERQESLTSFYLGSMIRALATVSRRFQPSRARKKTKKWFDNFHF
jgi:hypothetical protein